MATKITYRAIVCIFNEDKICLSKEIIYNPEEGCLTYEVIEDLLDGDEDEAEWADEDLWLVSDLEEKLDADQRSW